MSRFFDDMNRGMKGEIVCPLCGNNEAGQVLLVPIPGTEDGSIMQAEQVHRRCAESVGFYYLLASHFYMKTNTIYFQGKIIEMNRAKNIANTCAEALINEEN